jgi:hypothetical protein
MVHARQLTNGYSTDPVYGGAVNDMAHLTWCTRAEGIITVHYPQALNVYRTEFAPCITSRVAPLTTGHVFSYV